MLTCSKCKAEKSEAEFHRANTTARGFQSKCKECQRVEYKHNRRANLEYSREHYRRNRKKRNAQSSENYFKNTERVRAKQKEWEAANPGKVRSIRINKLGRRRCKLHGSEYVEDINVETKLKRQRGWCWYCRCAIDVHSCVADHIVSISQGGEHSNKNVKLCCAVCGEVKAYRTEAAFRKILRHYGVI